MRIRLATVGDVAGVAALVERYWEFESIGGFDRPRIETLLGGVLAEPERALRIIMGYAGMHGRLC